MDLREPTVDLEMLTSAVRRGVASVTGAVLRGGRDSAADPDVAGQNNPPPKLKLQPDFEPRSDNHYRLNELLQYHDRNFIQNAYRAILKRTPDTTGFESFVEGLRSGSLNKIDVLSRLRYSPEGREKNVRIDGLFIPALVRRTYRIPILGYLLQWMVALARLPRMVRNQQQVEGHLIAQQIMVADFCNYLSDEAKRLSDEAKWLSDGVKRLSSASEKQSRELERAVTELGERVQALISSQQELRAAYDESLARTRNDLDQLVLATRSALEDAARNESTRLDTRINETAETLSSGIESLEDALGTRLQILDRELLSFREAEASERRLGVAALRDELQARINAVRQEADRRLQEETRARAALKASLALAIRDSGQSAPPTQPVAGGGRSVTTQSALSLDAIYADLEERFRGSAAEIEARLRIYLPFIRKAGAGSEDRPVIDLGTGRGEWLDLLRRESLVGRGVDHNAQFVAELRERGLDVDQEDLLQWLSTQESSGAGAVTCFHVAEHLDAATLIRVMRETLRILRPGAISIFETPNPANVLVGSCNFYFDPTHRNPIPSQVLRFYLEECGFEILDVLDLNPSDTGLVEGDSELVKRFNHLFYGPMDYAVIARKGNS